MEALHSNWHLPRNNQHVSYSVLSWKGTMDIDGSDSKGTILKLTLKRKRISVGKVRNPFHA